MSALIKTVVASVGLAVAAGALAQTTTTELDARSYVLSAFISGAAHAIISSDVVVAPALRARLGLPASADSRAIYEALFALTEEKQLTVRGASPQEIGRTLENGHRAALVGLQTGDARLFFQYDLDRDNIVFVSDGSAPAPTIAASSPGAAAAGGTPAKPIELAPIRFDFDRATPDPAALEELEREVSARQVDVHAVRYVVRGFADDIGTARYNERLSRERAEALRDYLVAKGADPARIEVMALGSAMPQANCPANLARQALLTCLAPNRRVEVEIDFR
jgi:outer membrane protein OmpA-like peptidoglycan-associated protein